MVDNRVRCIGILKPRLTVRADKISVATVLGTGCFFGIYPSQGVMVTTSLDRLSISAITSHLIRCVVCITVESLTRIALMEMLQIIILPYILFVRVTRSINNLLCYKDFTARRAMRSLRQTGGCTSSRLGCINNRLMPGRNSLLRYQHLVTYTTVLAFCQTIFRTGFRFSSVNHVSMTESFDSLLRNKHFTTSGAVRALRQTGIHTGRRLAKIYNHCMLSSNLSLGYQNLLTCRAMFTFCQSIFCTCRFFSSINNFGMASRNHFLCDQNLITYRTMCTIC